MHGLTRVIVWMTLAAATSTWACTKTVVLDLRDEPVEETGAATEPEGDAATEAEASKANDDPFPTAGGGDAQTTVSCYEDKDGDGYPDVTPAFTKSGPCPAPYIPKRADSKFDCNDDDSEVHPDQQKFFSDPMPGGSFDYDCDGLATFDRQPVLACSVLAPSACVGSFELLSFNNVAANVATIGAVGCGAKLQGAWCMLVQGTCIYSPSTTTGPLSCK